MTTLDFAAIVFVIIFIVIGARLGSIWTTACLMGGFFGSFLVDYYALPMGSLLGHFGGSSFLAAVLLYIAGVLVFVVPGYILDGISSALLLGFLSTALGFFTGAFTGFLTLALLLLLVVPLFPKIEKMPAWKKSKIVKPFDERLEDLFTNPRFKMGNFEEELKHGAQEAKEATVPIAKGAEKVKDFTGDVINKFKK